MEAKIKSLELITQRLMRRASKRTTALITPYPISNAVFGENVEGPILRYMFPCSGTITKGIVRLGNKPKESVVLGIKMFNESNSASKGYALEKKNLSVELSLPVVAGDCLEVSIETEVEIVTEVWVSFLWRPNISDVEAKSYLVEELESDIQERTKSLTAE